MRECWTIILKPDTIKYSLDEVIISELVKEDINIKLRKILSLNNNHLKYIYPDKISTPKEEYALYSISHGISMLLIVEWENLYNLLKVFKWNWNKWWIRKKYLYPWREKLEELWFGWKELEFKLSENRLHTTDSYYESIYLLSWLISFSDLEEIKRISIKLYSDIYNIKIQNYLLTKI